MTLGLSLTIIILFAIAFLGLLVFLKNSKSRTNRLFVVMSFWIIVWIGSNFLENEVSSAEIASLFLRIDFASAAVLVYFWFLFCLNFPQPAEETKKIFKLIIFVPVILFAILSFSDLIIRNISLTGNGISFDMGVLYPVYILYIVSYMIVGGSGELIRKYRKYHGLQKTQTWYVLLGLSMSALPAVILNLFFQRILPVEIVRTGIYGAVFVIGFTAYAIVKKRLFGFKVIIIVLLVISIAFLLLIDTVLFTEKFSFQILKWINLIIFLIFGYTLIKNIIKEIKYREQIEAMAEQMQRAYEIEKKARRELERLDVAKNQFLLATQHHLRTPLTAMRGYIDLLQTGTYGKISSKVGGAVKKFEISTNRLLRVVNELLDVSQFQLGKKVVDLRPGVDIESLLKEIKEELNFEAETKGIYFKIQKPAVVLPRITADPEKLKVALFNLVDNALKYTSEGGVTIKFELTYSKLRLVVEDTGIGIPTDDLPMIFNRIFERSEKAQQTHATGRGIGLYITAQIVQAHNGKIWAESEGQGKGSTFYVEFPIK